MAGEHTLAKASLTLAYTPMADNRMGGYRPGRRGGMGDEDRTTERERERERGRGRKREALRSLALLCLPDQSEP